MKLYNNELRLIDRYIEKEPDPVEWIEKNISLPLKYAIPGPVKLDSFQQYIIRKTLGHASDKIRLKTLMICSGVQIGKSLLCELIICFIIRFRVPKMILCYATTQMIKRVIKERLSPLIQENQELNQFMTEYVNDINMDSINLTNGVMRIASAEAESTIATFASQVVYGSECAKYPLGIIKMLKGRKNAFEKMGDYLVMLESSPKFSDDEFCSNINEIPTHLYPHVKLSCGHWVFLEDKILHVIKDEKGKSIQNISILREDIDNVWIECPVCGKKIFEREHLSLVKGMVIWARCREDILNNEQQPEYKTDSIVFFLNKLLDYSYTFNKCITDFFAAKNKLDGSASLRLYVNETMGRPIEKIAEKETSRDRYEPVRLPYTIYASNNRFSNDIKFAMLGADLQEREIVYVIRGFTGKNTDTYLLDADKCTFDKYTENKETVYKRFREQVWDKKLIRENGLQIPLIAGICDSGGHWTDLIYHIASKIPTFFCYKGSRESSNAPILERSKTTNKLYLGNTELLCLQVNNLMYEHNFYCPDDVSEEYIEQLNGEYFIRVESKLSVKMKRHVNDNNHFRSAENYLQALTLDILFDAYNHNSKRIEAQISKFTQVNSSVINKEKSGNNLASTLSQAMNSSIGGGGWY